ncbi:hypothetical protein POF51_29530 [Brevibacillus sp. AG]|uniref:hypothetical protein n=1 Tax=Brevibacillus sp. AG TaxID=3020891 RepID=UPI00232CAFD9|nr:hypothetical protein [Brevibacillus sp. AG]MDC0764866.1 hypothetical protein [Brevibacillus sp. AG]
MTSFTYRGREFKALRKLKGKEETFEAVSKRIHDIGITPANWNYREFYKVASENGAGEIDLFEMDKITVIPAEYSLFQYK